MLRAITRIQRAGMVFRDHALEAYRPPQKLGDERRRRLFVNLRRTADLLEPAAMNHRHAVRQCHRFGLVVSDVKNREFEFHLQRADFQAHLLPQFRIEVRQRLIQQ